MTPRRLPTFAFAVALVAALAIALIAQRDPTPPPPARPGVSAATVARLRAENLELRAELVRSNVDQLDLHRRLAQLEQRANRGSRRTSSVRRGGDCGGWRQLVAQYPWDVDTACRVLMCESGGRADARNARSSATGLYQILGGPTDPAANVAQAYRMYAARGWQPWNASRSCWS